MSTYREGNEEPQPRDSIKYSGSLDSYSQNDLTPVIGTEYEGLQVTDILESDQCDRLIKDLAVTGALHPIFLLNLSDNSTVSRRGVVFLRDQHLTPQHMQVFGEKLSALAGCVGSFPAKGFLFRACQTNMMIARIIGNARSSFD
jgi:hypothetical protein